MITTIRKWQLSDVENLATLANNKEIANNLTDRFPHPYTEEHALNFIKTNIEHNPTQVFAIDFEGKAVGGIGIHPLEDIFQKNAELGYWVAQPYWGKGIITRSIEQIVSHTFDNFDIQRIFARPFGRNIGSQKALEKCGFKLEAKFVGTLFKNGVYEDELVYAIRKSEIV